MGVLFWGTKLDYDNLLFKYTLYISLFYQRIDDGYVLEFFLDVCNEMNKQLYTLLDPSRLHQIVIEWNFMNWWPKKLHFLKRLGKEHLIFFGYH